MSADEQQQAPQQATVGVVGLAVMGANLARNLASREGTTVAVFNRTTEKMTALVEEHPDGLVPTETIDDFVAALETPRAAIIMVQAGAGTDAVIEQLAERFEEGDVIVDGGNADFRDTIRREEQLRERGIHFMGVGISGGEEGALRGPSLMPGGSDHAWETLAPVLRSIAAVAEGEPCVTHVGTDGAGHFVKMVHNGIEYADMQLIAEAYDLLRRVGGLSPAEIADVFAEWNSGDLESYLVEITAEVLRQADGEDPLIDVVVDEAGSKGTGVWTVQNALGLGVPTSAIGEAVFARAVSASVEHRAAARETLEHPDPQSAPDDLADDLRAALYAAKVVAYAQGFDLIRAGAQEHDWDIDLGAIARIWRGGCIIRAKFLDRITEAYDRDADLVTLLADPYFAGVVADGEAAWRRVVALAVGSAVPAPAMSSSLAYLDALTSARLPAALIQLQRDFFGAHTYRRTDRDGTFHTRWAEDDRPEVDA